MTVVLEVEDEEVLVVAEEDEDVLEEEEEEYEEEVEAARPTVDHKVKRPASEDTRMAEASNKARMFRKRDAVKATDEIGQCLYVHLQSGLRHCTYLNASTVLPSANMIIQVNATHRPTPSDQSCCVVGVSG